MSTETMSPDVIVTTNSLQTVESAPAFTAIDESTWLDEDKDVSVKTGAPALTEEECLWCGSHAQQEIPSLCIHLQIQHQRLEAEQNYLKYAVFLQRKP